MRQQNRFDDVFHMNVGLALPAVAQDSQPIGLNAQPANKIEPDAVGLPGAHYVAEAERAGAQIEHCAIGRDQRLAGELAGAIGGDGNQRPEILLSFEILQIAIDAAAGGIEQIRRARAAHGFHNLLRQERAFAEIDVGLHGGARDVGIGSQVNNGIVAFHVAFERGQILHVAADHAQAAIVFVVRVMPLAAAGKIVVERDRFHRFVAQQAVSKMAADESGAAGDEERRCHRVISTDSHLVAARCNRGWLTSKCQSTAHSPSVCGVMRSGASAGMTMHSSAIWRVNPPLRPTMPKMCAPACGRGFQRADDVHRNVFLAAAAAHGKHQHSVARTDARTFQPAGKAGVPAFVVGAGGKLGDVVGGRVSFKAAQLAKIVDRVTGVSGRAADTQDEQTPAEFANAREARGHALNGGDVDAVPKLRSIRR